MRFRRIGAKEIPGNIMKMIGDDWMLITAGNLEKLNTMTASWGGMGVLWNKNVTFTFVRPQRYTREFMDAGDVYTLSFYAPEYRNALTLCGTKSGRDMDKVRETGFTPAQSETGAVYFEEASLVIACRKIYAQDIDPKGFFLPDIDKLYESNDYHRMYIGEILEVLVKD
jgi:flavin reductase (DIM6/NTAB) family NADH-FMN oxidoreductase RutF